MIGVTDADLGYPAWRGYVEWAFAQERERQRFTVETGIAWPQAARSALDALIDDATGRTEDVVQAFVLWASRHYGLKFCPPAVREAAEAARLRSARGMYAALTGTKPEAAP